jgi:hypothetical protein
VRTPPDGHNFHMAALTEPALAEPTPHVHASFVEAVREYRAEGRYRRLDPAQLADADQSGATWTACGPTPARAFSATASRRPTCGWSRATSTWAGCRYGTG